MSDNATLRNAKKAKKDEFYTQYEDIEKEMRAYIEYNPDVFKNKTILLPCDDPLKSNFTRYFAQNFQRFGIKKLISTSYSPESKWLKCGIMNDLFNPEYETMPEEDKLHGKLYVLDRDLNADGNIDYDDIHWTYLQGDGDFRSDEITKLRDECDMIITNPPFSLFRVFIKWVMDSHKQFSIIGNLNGVTYKEVFPLIMNNKVWFGPSISSGDREFGVPDSYPIQAAGWRVDADGNKFIRVKGVRWYTNIEHGRRHQPLQLMTMADNIKYSPHKEVKGIGYPHYDNYDAINVPFTECIPSDYSGVMGVPISFLDKYAPEQFKIVGYTDKDADNEYLKISGYKKYDRPYINGERKYFRIFIQKK